MLGNMAEGGVMEWISVEDRLPEPDYEKKKTTCRVQIKLREKEEPFLTCYFCNVFKLKEGYPVRMGHLFYDKETGETYTGVSHWRPV